MKDTSIIIFIVVFLLVVEIGNNHKIRRVIDTQTEISTKLDALRVSVSKLEKQNGY